MRGGWPRGILLVGLLGCGAGSPASHAEHAPANLLQIRVLYCDYCRRHAGVGPEDLGQFSAFIKGEGFVRANRFGIKQAELDNLFISPRDQLPLVVNYGLRMADEARVQQIVVRERCGRDDKCFAVWLNGSVEELSPTRAAEPDRGAN